MYYLTEIREAKNGEKHVLMLPDWLPFDLKQAVEKIAALCAEMRTHVREVSAKKSTFNELVIKTEEIEDRIAQIAGPLDNLYASMRTPEIEAAQNAVETLLANLRGDIWSDIGFYRAHRSFRYMRAYRVLGKEEKVAFGIQLDSFKDAGVLLGDRKKIRFRKIEEEVEVLCRKFEASMEDALNRPILIISDEAELAGIPETVKMMMRKSAEAIGKPGFALVQKKTIRVPVMKFAHNRAIREALFRAGTALSPAESPEYRAMLEQVLTLRHRAARMLGKKHHAERIIRDLMADSPSAVLRFLHSIGKRVRSDVKVWTAKLKQFARSELGYNLEPWDVEYVKNLFLKKEFGYTTADLEPYLRFPRVLKKLFHLAGLLYGVKIKERPDIKGWHHDVRFFEVYEHTGNIAGGFYLDPYARVGEVIKEGVISTECLLDRRRVSKQVIRLPITIIRLNLAVTDEGELSAFLHEDLMGLFHEFGHALENLLPKSHYLATGSGSLEADAKEIPSKFMENFAWDIETLAEMAKDKKTKRAPPLKLLLAIHRQRPVVEGFGRWSLLEDLERGLFDLYLHSVAPRKGCITRTLARARKDAGVSAFLPFDPFPDRFLYIFSYGYDGCHYAYLWSWRFAAAIRIEHLKTGQSVSPVVARRFRREFFEGSRTLLSKDNLTAFFGRKLPSAKALLEQSRLL